MTHAQPVKLMPIKLGPLQHLWRCLRRLSQRLSPFVRLQNGPDSGAGDEGHARGACPRGELCLMRGWGFCGLTR